MVKETAHKDDVAQGLHELSVLAGDAGAAVELALCHGAVISIAYRIEDGWWHEVRPNDIAVHLAKSISESQRLRSDWLETDAAIFIAEAVKVNPLRADEFAPGVILSVDNTTEVLAKKLHLLRAPLPADATDAKDAEYLLEKSNFGSPAEVKFIYARAFPEGRLSEAALGLIGQVFQSRSAVGSH
jgi:hypothetical protein